MYRNWLLVWNTGKRARSAPKPDIDNGHGIPWFFAKSIAHLI